MAARECAFHDALSAGRSTLPAVSAGIDVQWDPSADARAAELSEQAQRAYLHGIRGFAVLGHAVGELAVWGLAISGERGWAAVEYGDVTPDRARALLSVIERRALVGIDRDADLEAIRRLAAVANIAVPSEVEASWLGVLEMFGDVAEVRASIAAAGGHLSYNRSLPDAGGDVEQVLADLRLVPPRPESATACQALAVCVLISAAVGAWDDTEIARVRRSSLHGVGGPRARAVPDRWFSALTRAYSTTFEL